MYTGLDRLEIVPLIQDLLRYKDIKNIGEKIHYYTRKKRKIYTLKKKGQEKLKYFKQKYKFRFEEKLQEYYQQKENK